MRTQGLLKPCSTATLTRLGTGFYFWANLYEKVDQCKEQYVHFYSVQSEFLQFLQLKSATVNFDIFDIFRLAFWERVVKK